MAGGILGPGWYFSKREIEENSPSRQDGINAKYENALRRSFSSFQQELGMRLRLSQKTIATAIVFCHRFFLRQSFARNDRKLIGTACMLLATKVEDERRRLIDVVIVSHEIIRRISIVSVNFRNTVFEREKDLVLMAESVVLKTINFDFMVGHPYMTVVEAVRKLRVYNYHRRGLVQAACNFEKDLLRTSISVQFRPYHIAAAVILIAVRFLKVEVGPPNWWQWPEFGNVTMQQMKEICIQLLDMYEIEHRRIPRPC